MSREIKFKARDAIGDWVFGFLIKKTQPCGRIDSAIYDGRVEHIVYAETLSQYTGIKDKDGVEIYGSDIVMRTSTLPGSSDLVGAVEMLEGCWVIHYKGGAEKLWTECDINEVIGNIHENPKLLGGVNNVTWNQ